MYVGTYENNLMLNDPGSEEKKRKFFIKKKF